MNRITQQQLELYLWGAAVLLRGTIDAGDYKQFIFPLLFYKRLCDVFDEETEAALAESGGDRDFASYPENHRFQVPHTAHWSCARQTTNNVGIAIQSAMRAIETANPDTLYGIFGDAQWTNKERLSDPMLRDLIEHFSTLDLSIANLPEDELGQGYEYLIKKFADDSGHTAAEFYTNRTVVHLMTEMLEPQPGESIYDPTCGSGGMLLSCIAHLRRLGLEWRNVRLYGQERNLMTSSIARMNCFLHGIEDFQIVRGDTLFDPKFVEGDHLKRFDLVLANPPYSIKQWDREAFASDPWGRNLYGTPPQSIADYAFWQHILCSLAPRTGRCAILFPHGVLFRDAEADMRRKLIAADLIECIVGLGMNLFYNSSMPSCVVICRTAKPKSRKGKILLINAVNEVTRERAQSFLTGEHITRIVAAYREFRNQPGFAQVVNRDDVRVQDGNLNLSLYISPPAKGSISAGQDSITHELGEWFASRSSAIHSLDALLSTTRPPRIDVSISPRPAWPLLKRKLDWPRVRLGDTVDKTEETERDPIPAGFDRYLMVEHLDANCLRIARWGNLAEGNVPPTFYKVFRKGQILYPTRNPHLRRAALADFDGICGEKTLTLSPRDGIDTKFLAFVFQSEAFIRFATGRRIGSTNPHVRWRDVAQFEFNLPSFDDQRRIAEVLWGASHVKGHIEQMLRSVESYRRIYLIDAFQRLAEHCPMRPIREIGEVQLGRQRAPKYMTGRYSRRYLRVVNVIDGALDLRDVEQMDFCPDDFNRYKLNAGDVLITEGDVVSAANVGRSAIFRGEIEECCFQNTLIRFRPGELLTPEYAHAALQSAFYAGVFARLAGTTTVSHLGADKFSKVSIPIPERPIQESICAGLVKFDEATARLREYVHAYSLVFDSLTHTLVN